MTTTTEQSKMTRARAILAGCPEGATVAALELNGVDHDTLCALIKAREVTVRFETFAVPRRLTIARYCLGRST